MHGADFDLNSAGDTSVAGTLSTIGGADTDQVPPAPNTEELLFSLPVHADQQGMLTLTPNITTDLLKQVLLFNSASSVPWSDIDATLNGSNSLEIDVNPAGPPVNHAPAGADHAVSTLEDTPYVFSAADFGFSDPNDAPPNNLMAVEITTLPSSGSLKDNGSTISAGQFIPVADITSGKLILTPATNANGTPYTTFTFQVQDDGGTAGGGVDTDPSPNTITVNVTSVNDAPAGTSNTVTTLEDQAYTFAAADFGFNDPNDTPPNSLLAVTIASLPAVGTLSDNGTPVTGGQSIPLADITGGNLKFAPPPGLSGTSLAAFTFKVQDNGGTANGGVDTDPSANTLIIDVTSVNDAPVGTQNSVTIARDSTYTFAAADFGFTDPNDTPPNQLAAVKISTLPTAGTLTDNGTAVSAGQFISLADINAGKLQFAPAGGATGSPYAVFNFQVQDDGGVANGGVDTDPTPKTFTFNVIAVNQAPSGADHTVTMNEDGSYAFAVADFGFSDTADSPSNNLQAVKITTLPAGGSLTDNGSPVIAGQFIPVGDISGGLLVFTPAPNANGNDYGNFTFQVQDDGGTQLGGVDTDPTPRTMTIDVASINDAPSGADKTIEIQQNTPYAFVATDFGFTDPNDTPPDALLAVKITTLPAAGSLELSGSPVMVNDVVLATDIAAGNLIFTPAPAGVGMPYAMFDFQVQDDGGTASGGVDTDPTAHTLTLDVFAVNEPPVGTDNTVTTLEDMPYTFAEADFGFTDPNDTPPNNLLAVEITTLPADGALTDDGVAVTAGQFVSVADITSGKLQFAPAPDANGASYASFTFQVQDDGGTANGGVDLDPTARTMTINVTSVNDAPEGADW